MGGIGNCAQAHPHCMPKDTTDTYRPSLHTHTHTHTHKASGSIFFQHNTFPFRKFSPYVCLHWPSASSYLRPKNEKKKKWKRKTSSHPKACLQVCHPSMPCTEEWGRKHIPSNPWNLNSSQSPVPFAVPSSNYTVMAFYVGSLSWLIIYT